MGGAGNDSLFGDEGNDRLNGGAGRDTLIGSSGNDVLIGGSDGILPFETDDDLLDGGDGNDQLIGGGGNDRLYGGEGNDKLNGGFGWDLLVGGNGDDTLIGGSGSDELRGEMGNDVFIFVSASDSSLPFYDTLADFEPGRDKIDLSRIDANIHRAGDQAFVLAKALTGVAGQLVIDAIDRQLGLYSILADIDGDRSEDFFAVVQLASNARALTISDFIL